MGIGAISAYGQSYGIVGYPALNKSYGVSDAHKIGKNNKTEHTTGVKKSTPAECQTCKKRKYQDGSNENVSFKSAQHISPTQAGSAVRSHESEHVANAYKKAAEKGGKVMRASVALHMAICPECGRSYVAGGTTSTAIKYPNEQNPYQKNMKSQQSQAFRGMYFDVKG